MKGTAHTRCAHKDAMGTNRKKISDRLRERRDGLRALLKTHEAVEYEKRDLKYLIHLKKKIDATIHGLRSHGDDAYINERG